MTGMEDAAFLENNHARHVQVHAEALEEMKRQMWALTFPADKKKIARLSHDDKMEWYQHRFEESAKIGRIPVEFTTDEFARFWKWHVVVPMKFKRFFYRVKNLEIFKRYQHITEIKKAREKR